MTLLFHFISKLAETRALKDTIHIAGIDSQVYALLTATPMHNLMMNIALVFFIVATFAIIYIHHCKKCNMLAIFGVVCIIYTELWGALQKVSFILTTAWLFAVHLAVKSKLCHNATSSSG